MSAIANGVTPDRDAAMRYIRYRDFLLDSRVANLLPGFLLQCISVVKFRTFITLYDLHKRARSEFLNEALAPARRALFVIKPTHSAFSFDIDEL